MNNLQYIEGDIINILESEKDALVVHQANCFHTMGGGIARVLSTKYPAILRADKDTPRGLRGKMGTASICEISSERNIHVANVYSQYSHGSDTCHTEYEEIAHGNIDAINNFWRYELNSKVYSIKTVYIPFRYGSGLGGGDWAKVYTEFDRVSDCFPNIDFKIVVLPAMKEDAFQFTQTII